MSFVRRDPTCKPPITSRLAVRVCRRCDWFSGCRNDGDCPNFTLSGQINENSESFVGFRLENPREAEVHLAVAPHGGLDPDLMPDQIKTPGGGPEHWCFAVFESPA